MTSPHPTPAAQLQPGDTCVLSPGDVRTVHHVTLTPSSAGLVNVSWGDGRHSLLDSARTLVVLK